LKSTETRSAGLVDQPAVTHFSNFGSLKSTETLNVVRWISKDQVNISAISAR